MNDRLAVKITTGDGTVHRWSGDEPDARSVPQGITFSTSIPGGYSTATITLAREITLDFPDLNLYDEVEIYGPGAEVAWKGRVAALPRSHDAVATVSVQCVGLVAHLRDDSTFTEIYVDADLDRWREASRARKIANLTGTTVKFFDPSVNSDSSSGVPGIRLELTGALAAGDRQRAEAWYDAGPGQTIDAIYYDFQVHNLVNTSGVVEVATSDDDLGTNTDVSADLYGSNSAAYRSPTADYRFAFLRFRTEADTTGEVSRWCFFRKVRVYGNHGLTRVGDTDPKGFYASDIVRNVVTRAAPLLEIDEIEQTSFVVPHAAFFEPTTAEEVISAVNVYDLHEWGVYENGFFYRATDPDRLVWEARLGGGEAEGALVELEGPAGDEVYNGVIVNYPTFEGLTSTVGPVGSGAEDEDDTLLDADPLNPVNAHNIPRRYFPLTLSRRTTSAGAIRLGAQWLADQAQPQRRGQVTLRGQVRHPTRGLLPVWKVRAGDYIKIADHSGDVARRIIDTSYDEDSRTLTCSLDNSAARLEAIVARLGS